MSKAHYLRIGAALGHGIREVMLMPPGLLFDEWELYLRSHQPVDTEEI